MIAVVSAVLGLLWSGTHLWDWSKGREAAGIFLVDGGKYLLVLEHSPWKGLTLSEGTIRAWPWLASDDAKARVSFRAGEIRYSQTQRTDHCSGEEGRNDKVHLSLSLAPSERVDGDWDLVDGKLDWSKGWSVRGVGRRIARVVVGRFGILGQYRPSDPPLCTPYDRSGPALKSFFHRVDDPRLLEYFEMRKAWGPHEDQRVLMASILKDHPGDPVLELHAIEMEALVGDPFAADKMLNEWKGRNREDPRDPLSQSACLVGNTISLAMAEKKGYPKDPFIYFFAGPPASPVTARMSERLDRLKNLVDYDYLTPEVVPLLGELWPNWDDAVPNYFEAQTALKTVNTLSDFAALQGNRKESLALLAGSYRLGQSTCASFRHIDKLIGSGFCRIAMNGLTMHILNACETTEDLEECRYVLERLYRVPYRNAAEYVLLCEAPSFGDPDTYVGLNCNFSESKIQLLAADARFELLRTALAARYCLLKTDAFPENDRDFVPFFDEGLPKDPFGGGAVKYKLRDDDRFCVYSNGPDKDDDNAAVEYDQRNGTFSDGDIYIDIPGEREFPFPKDGVKAENAAELLAQFPNGLPLDLFAENGQGGKYPLGIVESTTGAKVIVVGCGPDRDHPLTPKNATGLFYPSKPPHQTDDPATKQKECVFLLWDTNVGVLYDAGPPEEPKGYWHLQPMYDPTNGTTSNGDLFIEIPR